MKSVLITGTNKGIGLETARQLLQNGFHVYLASRNLNSGQDAAQKLKSEGLTQVEVIELDVTDGNSVKLAREEIGKKTDVLDVLINNAGINGGIPPYIVSKNYLNDMLKSLTGLTTQQHIQNYLIEEAKELLSTTSLSVNAIAYQLGFEYPQSFNKLFKNKTEQTPLQFRQSFN